MSFLPRVLAGAPRPRFYSSRTGAVLGAVCTSYSKPLEVRKIPRFALKDNQVRLKVHGAGINFDDLLQVRGKYQVKLDPPFVCGYEVAGEVLEVGSAVHRLKVGDSVVSLQGYGCFAQECVSAEYACTKLNRLPAGASLVQAAAIPCTFGTAHLALKLKARVQPGETVLVTAAAGGVGLASVKLAKLMGANVIALAGSEEKLAVCKSEGADHCINYKGLEPKKIREAVKATGSPIDVVIDMVGGAMTEQLVRSLTFDGRFVVVGFASGDIPKLPLNLLLLKNASVTGLFWGSYMYNKPQPLLESQNELFEMWAEGKLSVTADYFKLDQINTAIHALENRLSTGKVIVTPNE